MIAIQYRDAETEALLECARSETLPAIDQVVRVGVERYRVLYRWRSGPSAPAVYVRKLA